MGIIPAKLFFETDRDEDGCLLGIFLGEGFVSGPIYSQEMAFKVLRGIVQLLCLSKEEKIGVEVCIENSNLPLSSSEEEKNKIRLNNLETQMENIYEIMEENASHLDRELDKNLMGGETPPNQSIH